MSPRHLPQRFARLMPWGFVLIAAFLFGVGGALLLAHAASTWKTESQPSPPGQSAVDALNELTHELKGQLEELKNQAEVLNEKENDLKWILGLIVITGGLFTVAQGIAAGFTAKSFTEQAEKALGEARAQFEILELLETARKKAVKNLDGLANTLTPDASANGSKKDFNWERSFYERMPVDSRQRLVSIDRILPWELIGAQHDSEGDYVVHLRQLGLFYWAKFVYEGGQLGAGSLGDLERSEYLIDLAIGRIGPAFFLLNDLGNIHLEHYNSYCKARPNPLTKLDGVESLRILDKAQQKFEASVAAQKSQLRAHFNLAFIEASKRSNPGQGIHHLEVGLGYQNWETGPQDEFRCNAYYNLACYHARLGHTPHCLAALREAAKLGRVYPPTDVERDFNEPWPIGDFHDLVAASTAAERAEFKRLEIDLTRHSRK